MQGRLPPLTPLQFVVLGALLDGERAGRAVREAIAKVGVRRSAPAFYQMMARLERARLVEGWYEQVTVGDQAVTERRYRIRPAGAKLWQATRAFYVEAGATRPEWSDA